MPVFISILMVGVGLINFVPLVGLFSVDQMQASYAITVTDPNLEILLRHRAVLFGIVGGYILIAAFRPAWQPTAIVFAGLSMMAFIILCLWVGDYSASIERIMMGDVAGTILLAMVIVLRRRQWPGQIF
jgi:hypothetical protein